jgi:hypothetical protein
MQNIRIRTTLSASVFAALFASVFLLDPAYAQSDSGSLPPGVVARQGGVDVTLEDIDAYAHKIPDKDRAGYFDSPQRIENTIMGLLTQRQLAGMARAAKLDQDPDVQRQLALAEEDALARVYLMGYRKDIKLPNFDALAKEYYLAHQDEFGPKESRKPFEEVREPLIKKLRERYIDAQTDQFTGELRSKSLDANPDLVASLRTRYLPPGAVLPSEAATAANEEAAKKKAAEQKAVKAKASSKP